jgi:hypothetical protein
MCIGTARGTRALPGAPPAQPSELVPHPPRPLKIPGAVDLKTLADVRTMIGHLPKAVRTRDTWRYVERELKKAAAGNDTSQISVALQMALQLERIEYK